MHEQGGTAVSVHQHRRRTATVIAALFLAMVLCLILVMTNQPRRASARLPQTIEDYRAVLKQPDFGMYFLDFSSALAPPTNVATIDDAKLYVYEMLGRRSANFASTESIGNLVANYSAVSRKRVSFGKTWREVTNTVLYDDSKPRTRRETMQLIESILRTNGGFIFPLNATNVVLLTEKDLKDLAHPIPDRSADR